MCLEAQLILWAGEGRRPGGLKFWAIVFVYKNILISSSPSNIFDLNVLVYQQNFEILCSFTKKIIYCPSELCGGFSGTTLVCVCFFLPLTAVVL